MRSVSVAHRSVGDNLMKLGEISDDDDDSTCSDQPPLSRHIPTSIAALQVIAPRLLDHSGTLLSGAGFAATSAVGAVCCHAARLMLRELLEHVLSLSRSSSAKHLSWQQQHSRTLELYLLSLVHSIGWVGFGAKELAQVLRGRWGEAPGTTSALCLSGGYYIYLLLALRSIWTHPMVLLSSVCELIGIHSSLRSAPLGAPRKTRHPSSDPLPIDSCRSCAIDPIESPIESPIRIQLQSNRSNSTPPIPTPLTSRPISCATRWLAALARAPPHLSLRARTLGRATEQLARASATRAHTLCTSPCARSSHTDGGTLIAEQVAPAVGDSHAPSAEGCHRAHGTHQPQLALARRSAQRSASRLDGARERRGAREPIRRADPFCAVPTSEAAADAGGHWAHGD